ncbi:PIN domain-containing protein [Brevibacterium sp. K11IcPPYGO002]|uniref:PIN domain-containing protein n=1 Tax=Brevibacterium sp. K11IcPPYGO002 TaxID=3058837 RepID=UPI003D81BA4F
MPQRVFVDANIFFSRTLLDWMFHLRQANEGMFQLHSTEDVFAEVLSNMREKDPTAPGHVTRHRLELMKRCVDEVIQDFPGSGEFSGQDPKDYHVHAAALAAGSDFIVSADDPSDITTTPDAQPYDVVSPDDFFLLVVDSSPDRLLPITRSQYEYWKSRPRYRQLDEALLRAGCQQFATRVRSALSELAQIPE